MAFSNLSGLMCCTLETRVGLRIMLLEASRQTLKGRAEARRVIRRHDQYCFVSSVKFSKVELGLYRSPRGQEYICLMPGEFFQREREYPRMVGHGHSSLESPPRCLSICESSHIRHLKKHQTHREHFAAVISPLDDGLALHNPHASL